jgi:hypothetical protein
VLWRLLGGHRHPLSRPVWHDTAGNVIQAHGGGITKVGGTGYFLSEDRTNKKLQIYRLSADYLSVSALVKTLDQYEAPALAKIGGTYYPFGSHLTGWSTNDNQYATATSITGTPLTTSGTSASIAGRDSWTIDATTGVTG